MAKSTAGTNKMMVKLENSVKRGDFYEAQQMYKSVSARYLAQSKFAEAMDLLQAGACIQLQHGQVACGGELGLLLVDALSKSGTLVSAQSLARISSVFEAFLSKDSSRSTDGKASDEGGGGAGEKGEEGEGGKVEKKKKKEEEERNSQTLTQCVAFLKSAVKWSVEYGESERGDPSIHDMLASFLWNSTSDLESASRHFIMGSSVEKFFSAIRETMAEVYATEVDLVLVRAVLQYLAVGNLKRGNELMDLCMEQRKKAQKEGQAGPLMSPALDSPLVHFTQFLLRTLERNALPLFRLLRERYSSSISRDPTFVDFLDEIAYKFYGVRKSGGLGDIMKMFMGDF